MFINIADAHSNATLAFYSQGDDFDARNSRTILTALLQTLALRLVVICAYGHLGSLQGLSQSWKSASPRMILLVLCPGATLASFIGAYFQGLVILGASALNFIPTSWRFSLAVAMQVHAPLSSDAIYQEIKGHAKQATTTFDEPSLEANKPPTLPIHITVNTNGIECALSSEAISLADVPCEWHVEEWIKRKTRPDARCWHTFLLDIARATVILAVFAKAVASLVLVVRRAQIPGATLLLDSTTGLYAVIGILTTVNSLLLMVIGDKWEVVKDAPLKQLHGSQEKGFLMVLALGLVIGMLPMSFLRGQRLLNKSNFCGFPRGMLRLDCSTPPLPTFVAHCLMMLTMVAWVCFKALPPLFKGWKGSRRKIYDVLGFLGTLSVACYFGILVSNLLAYWIAQIYELIVIARGTEMAVWGVAMWRWHDPWSDMLSVY